MKMNENKMICVDPIDKESDLFSMKEIWNQLLSESKSETVFLTWEWLTSWWKAYGNGCKLFILRISKDGRVIGLAPFYMRKITKYGLSYRTLALLGDGSGDSDYLDWISVNGEEDCVSQAVMDFLSTHSEFWDIILLNEIPEASLHIGYIRQFCRDRGWYWEDSKRSCAYVNLPADWNEYLKSLKPRMRTKIRSLTSQLEEKFNVRIEQCNRESDLPGRLASLFDLHAKRWSLENKKGVFTSSEKQQFYQEMASVFISRGWLRFYSMSNDERYLAHQFCFEYSNIMFLLQEGFDPEWEQFGVGNVLRSHVFRDCINRGVRVYDFLGGVTSHKLSWGSEVKNCLRVSIGLPLKKNKLFFEFPKIIDGLKKIIKDVLPESVVLWLKSKSAIFNR